MANGFWVLNGDIVNVKVPRYPTSEEIKANLPIDPVPTGIVNGFGNLASEYIDKWLNSRNQNIEMLAAAFLKETGLSPTECELVEQIHSGEVTWFFRRKKMDKSIGCSIVDWCELHGVDHGHPVKPSESMVTLLGGTDYDAGDIRYDWAGSPYLSICGKSLIDAARESAARESVEEQPEPPKDERVCTCASLINGHDNDCAYAEKKDE